MHAGSVTFSTELDNAQLEKDLNNLTKKIERTEQDIADLTAKRDHAQGILDSSEFETEKKKLEDMKTAREEYLNVSKEITSLSEKENSLATDIVQKEKDRAEVIQQRSEILDRLSVAEGRLGILENSPIKDKQKIREQKEEVRGLAREMNKLDSAVQKYDAAIKKSAERLELMKLLLAQLVQKLDPTAPSKEKVDEQSEKVKALNAEWRIAKKDVASYNTKLTEAEGTLCRQKEEAGHLVQQIEAANSSAAKISGAMDKAGVSVGRLTDRIKKLASRVFVFTLISTALRGMRTWMEKVVKTNSEARQSIAQLKAALLTLAQPLMEVIIPAFTTLVNILARVVTVIAQLVSMLFGKTLKQSKDGAKALYKEASAIEGIGAAAEEAAGSLAGFDEINTINTENADGAGGGASANTDIAPDFSWADGMDGILDRIKEIADQVGLIAAGLALWKISGMLPGVLGTIAQKLAGILLTVGGLLLYWDGLTDAWENGVDWFNLIEMIGGLAAAAFGLYLLFGPIAAGITLVVGGLGMLVTGIKDVVENGWSLQNMLLIISGLLAAGLGISMLISSWIPLLLASIAGLVVAIVANWDEVKGFLQGSVGFVTGLISGALLVLGAILLFSSANIGLGLGLLVAGAIGLAASLAANWDTVQQALEGPVGTVTALISGALLVLGAILLFSGAATPLGIGLMAAGAVGLVTAIAANWNTVQTALHGPINAVAAIASGALLVLGIILLFTGAAIPLGLGLIATGAAGLAATVAPNWDFVLDAIKGAWKNVKNWWKANAEKFFTLDYWKDLGNNMIKGLLDGLEGIFSGLRSWASNVWNSITGVFSGNNAKASIQNSAQGGHGRSSIAAYSLPVDVSMPSIAPDQIPRLAKGAVIPPNREFMAVLGDQSHGTNLEAPEDLIRQIVREESGSGNAELTQLLRAILSAVKEGHVIMVDGSVFGRTAIKTINSANIAAGKQLLLI